MKVFICSNGRILLFKMKLNHHLYWNGKLTWLIITIFEVFKLPGKSGNKDKKQIPRSNNKHLLLCVWLIREVSTRSCTNKVWGFPFEDYTFILLNMFLLHFIFCLQLWMPVNDEIYLMLLIFLHCLNIQPIFSNWWSVNIDILVRS